VQFILAESDARAPWGNLRGNTRARTQPSRRRSHGAPCQWGSGAHPAHAAVEADAVRVRAGDRATAAGESAGESAFETMYVK
jgi:hypothetical protein